MDRLFDTEETVATAPAQTAVKPVLPQKEPSFASSVQIRDLVDFGYKHSSVETWTAEKAAVVIQRCKNNQRCALNRAARIAYEEGLKTGEYPPRPEPRSPCRPTTATYLQEILDQHADNGDELCMALSSCVWDLTTDEARRLAGYLARLMRGEQAHDARRGTDGTGDPPVSGDRDERPAGAEEEPAPDSHEDTDDIPYY